MSSRWKRLVIQGALVPAAFAASALSSSAVASAAAPAHPVSHTIVARVPFGYTSPDASGIACEANVYGSFTGTNNGGIVSGTWSPWYENTTCTGPMLGIEVKGTIGVNGGVSASSPSTGCGGTPAFPCNANQTIQSNGPPVACASCAGTWTVTGYFYYDFPYVPGATIYGPNCQSVGLDQQECTLSASTIIP
jgi:hypothetical protein